MLLIAWIVVVAAFIVLAIQLFVTLIEFKLTTLAGFVLVPFGLFNRTAFLAERTLGGVMASGIKVLVLAVIVGIGSTLFGEFTSGFPKNPTIDDALTVAMGALTLLGLGIFGPGIAAGLGSGAPQLGGGAVVGTGLLAGGAGAAAIAAVGAVAGAGGKALAGAVMPSGRSGPSKLEALSTASKGGGSGPSGSGGASPLRPGPSGSGPQGGAGKGADADKGSSSSKPGAGSKPSAAKPSSAQSSSGGADSGAQPRGAPPSGAGAPSGAPSSAGSTAAGAASGSASGAPEWAAQLRRQQALHQGVGTAAHALRSGDHGGAGTSLDLSQE